MKKILSLICLVLCISCCFSCGNASESSDTENKSDGNTSGTEIVNTDSEKNDSEKEDKMRLGAYVWYGFSYEGNHYTDRLMTEFAGREPIWGWTEDSLSNMAYQIQIAKENGLSFFAFDWYYGHPELNQAVMNFSRAEGQEDMEFASWLPITTVQGLLMIPGRTPVIPLSDICRRKMRLRLTENR